MIKYGGTCHSAGIGNESTAQDMINQEHAMVAWAKAFGFPPPQSRFPETLSGAMSAAYAASSTYERPAVAGSDVHSQFISQVWNGLRMGGIISEPVIGRGLHTGSNYMLGEDGPESVTPLRYGATTGRGGGGNTYVTVQAGVVGGTPQQVGQAIYQTLADLKRQKGGKTLGL
jgi:hypothetical protein